MLPSVMQDAVMVTQDDKVKSLEKVGWRVIEKRDGGVTMELRPERYTLHKITVEGGVCNHLWSSTIEGVEEGWDWRKEGKR